MARVSPRYHLVGFGQDMSLFVAWAVIPLWAERNMHATADQLGTLTVTGGIAYVSGSLFAGKLSDRVPRTLLARLGLLLFAGFCLLAWRAGSIPFVYWVAPLSGFANALIWPPLQAKMGDDSGPGDMESNIRAFSVAWCLGKAVSFFLAESLFDRFGLDTLVGCAAVTLLMIPLVPGGHSPHAAAPAAAARDPGPPAAVREAYLRSAWLANFAAYGLGATVQYLYVKETGKGDYSPVLGTMFLVEAAGFWLFGRWTGWHYRPGAFLLWQGLSAAAILLLGLGGQAVLGVRLGGLPALAIAAAAIAGLGQALCYMASIYYSIHSDADRGKRAGLHEAFTGASNFVVPKTGGWLADAAGARAMPYYLGAAVAVGGAVLQAVWIRKAARASR